MIFTAMMAVALLLDAAFGWPRALFLRLSHPVVWFGALIAAFEARLNVGNARARRVRGGLSVVLVVLCAALPAFVVQLALARIFGAQSVIMTALIGGALAWPLLALRSLYDHVAAVARPLLAGDLERARAAVSMIVGRDPAQLDRAGMSRAALESLAENTSDGVIAPLFWGLIAGLPGIAAYKAINTMDSMIGHRSPRYEDFGMAAARLDDIVNFVPARVTGLLFALCAPRIVTARRVMLREARGHRSPNAGWPEAAMARALNVRLCGPRNYGTQRADEPWLNPDAPDPTPLDITRGLALYRRTMICTVLLVLVLLSVFITVQG